MPVNDAPGEPTPTTLVAIPGTGSDADFIRRAFGPAAADLGLTLIALDPTNDLVNGYRAQLEQASKASAPIVVGGVSIGAAIALEWALGDTSGRRCAGVWAALPAWSGSPDTAVAAASAQATAHNLRCEGLDATIAAMVSTSPQWLAAELTRSWRALYPGLTDQLFTAANYHAPECADIAGLTAPLALAAAPDDPLHPIDIARSWSAAAPHAHIETVTLSQWGADPSVLGHACASGWLLARSAGATAR